MARNEKFKEVIDRARGKLSIPEFAEKAGISFSTLYRWLRGQQKMMLRKDIINKIVIAADSESGRTERDVYDAAMDSIEGSDASGRGYAKKLSDVRKNATSAIALKMLGEGKGIQLVQSADCDFAILDSMGVIHKYDICNEYAVCQDSKDFGIYKDEIALAIGRRILNGDKAYSEVYRYHFVMPIKDKEAVSYIDELMNGMPALEGYLEEEVNITIILVSENGDRILKEFR